MNIVFGLAPFLAFFALTRFLSVAGALWAAAAVAAALNVRAHFGGSGLKVLEAGAFVLFVVLAVAASVIGPAWTVFEVRLMVDVGLIAIVFGSILIGKPFTLQYAREMVTPAQRAHPLFLSVNRTISAVWGLAFIVEAIATAVVAWLPAVPPVLPVIANLAALAGAIYFTSAYPRRVRARMLRGIAGA